MRADRSEVGWYNPGMGVTYDYFRAGDDEAASRALDSPRDSSMADFDAVPAKWIDPAVVLGKLVALIRDEPWNVELVPLGLCGDGAATEERLVCGLGQDLRDTLAGVDDNRTSELARGWAAVEELATLSDPVGNLVVDLIGLARRARAARDHLYVLISL
ncbi:hypothetical protein SAXI111661_20900 [Saccharomonospora xinjiangensis]|uniref:hypothetical protein n=1 Tax=Saccharomonospora xinjiangensis TaxID=75294 RepID=UPI00106FAEB8|nr:hypothetical protein [Saccharomonospora xinjiangensis]QBQ61515.1 hypothetical protein EYD13_15840 [Saccharomonospora xinjiangensis]